MSFRGLRRGRDFSQALYCAWQSLREMPVRARGRVLATGGSLLGLYSLVCMERALCPTRLPAGPFPAPSGGSGQLPRGRTGGAVVFCCACAAPGPIGGRRARGPGQWRRASVPRAVAKGSGGRGPIATAGPRWTERRSRAVPPPTGEPGLRRRLRDQTGGGRCCVAWQHPSGAGMSGRSGARAGGTARQRPRVAALPR